MTSADRRRCRSCPTILRRGQTSALCDPCASAARSYGQCPVPTGFYDTPALRLALARYEFGPVLRAVRAQAALTQEDLGFLINLPQGRISAVEAGTRRLRDVTVIARLARTLGIPANLLGFGSSPGSVNGEQEVSWVERRDFLNTVMALTLGIGIDPELDRLETLLPTRVDPEIPRRIGHADVEAIERTTAAFRAWNLQYGGGLSRAATVAQLRAVLELRNTACSEDVRARLLLAIADLANTAAHMTYDVEQHDAARRLWMIALDTARRAEHPHSTDLAATMLQFLTEQAVHLNRPQEALKLIQLASVTAAGGKYPISAITHATIASRLGLCRAALGDAQSCRRALGQALENFAEADPKTAPPWAIRTDAQIASRHGHPLFLLSLTDPSYAPQAIEQLSIAVEGYSTSYARSRAIDLPALAGAYFRAGEVDSAVTAGHDAVTATSTLSSRRAYTRLRTLAADAEPYATTPDVAELRERIRTTLTTA